MRAGERKKRVSIVFQRGELDQMSVDVDCRCREEMIAERVRVGRAGMEENGFTMMGPGRLGWLGVWRAWPPRPPTTPHRPRKRPLKHSTRCNTQQITPGASKRSLCCCCSHLPQLALCRHRQTSRRSSHSVQSPQRFS